eukprot:12909132-Prorocentrum_lima.AAC.1
MIGYGKAVGGQIPDDTKGRIMLKHARLNREARPTMIMVMMLARTRRKLIILCRRCTRTPCTTSRACSPWLPRDKLYGDGVGTEFRAGRPR